MSAQGNLHGGELQQSRVALVLIDVINDLDFPEGPDLLKHALPMAARIAELRERAMSCEVPVIYANDNFGRWRSDFRAQVSHCRETETLGRPLAEILHPGEDDYFVLKPRASAFFSTTLELLLKHLSVKTLVLTGIAGNHCVQFTAADAYLREFRLIVPNDCVASNTEVENRHGLDYMQRILKADVRPSTELTEPVLRTLASREPTRHAASP